MTSLPRREKRLLAFLVYPGVTPLDLVGPLTVLRNLTGTAYRTVVVAARFNPLPTDAPVKVVPTATFRNVPSPYAVIVPGGGEATLAARDDGELLGYIRSAAATARLVGAIGNGTLLLAAAGLLQRHRAATHWAYADELERHGVTWAREGWVQDGRFLTAAGGTAGIDMMLALLDRLKGRSSARLAQLFMEYDPEPPLGPLGAERSKSEAASVVAVPRPRAATQDPQSSEGEAR